MNFNINIKHQNVCNVTPKKKNLHEHPFHIVDPSPWPFFVSVNILSLIIAFVRYLHSDRLMPWTFFSFFEFPPLFFVVCFFISTCFMLFFWFRDIVLEATFEGHHTAAVQKGLSLGMVLFIVSEAMFFLAFFWAFFHSSLVPAVQIGCIWPPKGIDTFDPWGIPFLNTIILLSSGATLTLAHYALLNKCWITVSKSLCVTIIYGLIFTCLQGFEYKSAPFDISDGIYGSVFFLLTGFHGFHVIVGTIFLAVCLVRHFFYHFTPTVHLNFEFAAWYWHFVDAVWLGLFVAVYLWGGSSHIFEDSESILTFTATTHEVALNDGLNSTKAYRDNTKPSIEFNNIEKGVQFLKLKDMDLDPILLGVNESDIINNNSTKNGPKTEVERNRWDCDQWILTKNEAAGLVVFVAVVSAGLFLGGYIASVSASWWYFK